MISVERILEYTNLEEEGVEPRGRAGGDGGSFLHAAARGGDTANPVAVMAPGGGGGGGGGGVSDVFVRRPLDAAWPTRGDVRLVNVHARYRADLEPVLRGLTAHVRGGSKVGRGVCRA